MSVHAVYGLLLPCLRVSLASFETAFEGDYRFGPSDDVMARDSNFLTHSTTGTTATSGASTVQILCGLHHSLIGLHTIPTRYRKVLCRKGHLLPEGASLLSLTLIANVANPQL